MKSRSSPEDSIIGKNIKRIRMLRGQSQEELADAIGVTYQQVQKYERGANRISAVRLVDIAQALDASTSDLLSLSQQIKDAEGLSSKLLSKDTTELLRLYSQVKGKENRKNVLRFLRMLAESGQD